MVEFLLVLLGLAGLWLGTRWMINGALGFATRFNLSHSFVGVAILAVGTDLPEVFVTINASIQQLRGINSSGIITGNALGSSISQITVILGIAALFMTFTIPKAILWRDGITLVVTFILLLLFGLDGLISRTEGFILISAYVIYYILLLKNRTPHTEESNTPAETSKPPLILGLYLLAGLAVLIYASVLVVENAMTLAHKWGVAQSFVGIAIIGLGTSLPELAVSIGAALRKSAGLSVGNIIGSNIFDGLIPIGLGGAISTTEIEPALLRFDIPYLAGATLLVLLFLFTKRGISKPEAIVLIAVYVTYIGLKIYL